MYTEVFEYNGSDIFPTCSSISLMLYCIIVMEFIYDCTIPSEGLVVCNRWLEINNKKIIKK